jgi:hypothetical protein
MSTYKIPTINAIKPQVVDLGFYCDVQFDPSDAKPIYIGLHVTRAASDDDTEWKILKFTYSGDDTTRIQTAYGTYTGRAGLF